IADVRLTVVGHHAFAVQINTAGGWIDWRRDYDRLTYRRIDTPDEIYRAARAYLDRLGLVYGCFDFALATDGRWVFLECNPAGQWGWLEDITGAPIAAAFADVLMQEGPP
ncbi:MAG: ATP-grasp ribosomal peptide maturase, partial [Haloechinothrix sp.]